MSRLHIATFLLAFGALAHCTPSDAASCPGPDESFRSFLARFTEEVEFQHDRTVLPLVYRKGNFHDEINDIELWNLKRIAKLKEPMIPSRKVQRRYGLVQSVPVATRFFAQAYYEKPDADSYRMLFSFRNVDGCWHLEEVYDASL